LSVTVILHTDRQIDRVGLSPPAEEGAQVRRPIDTSRLKFLVVAPAEPLRQFEEGKPREAWAPRTDANGEVLWRTQLVALGDGEAEIIRVAVPGDPKVAQGEMVSVDALTAQAWEMEGRSGMAFRCQAIGPAAPRAARSGTEKAAA
jgi:hypothetical protein